MQPAPPAPGSPGEFAARVLATEESRVMAVSYLRAAAIERRSGRASDHDQRMALNFDVLADLYANAEHPYPDVEETWRDMVKYHRPPLTAMDAPVGSPAARCSEG